MIIPLYIYDGVLIMSICGEVLDEENNTEIGSEVITAGIHLEIIYHNILRHTHST